MESLDALRLLIAGPGDRLEKARQAVELIRAAGPYRWVGLYDVSATEISAFAWTGSDPPAFPRFEVSLGLSGAAVQARAPVIVQDVSSDPGYLTAFRSTKSEAIFPIVSAAGEVVGTIDVESDTPDAFRDSDRVFLEGCAEVLAPLWS